MERYPILTAAGRHASVCHEAPPTLAADEPRCRLYHLVDDARDRTDGADEACRFAEPHSGVIWITVCEGLQVAGSFDSSLLCKF